MADTAEKSKYTPQTKFYRSSVAGLKIITGAPVEGGVKPEQVRFAPFEERYEGERIRVGYLYTEDARVIKRLKDDPNVTEIDEEEYEKHTDTTNPKVKALPL